MVGSFWDFVGTGVVILFFRGLGVGGGGRGGVGGVEDKGNEIKDNSDIFLCFSGFWGSRRLRREAEGGGGKRTAVL